MLFIYTKTVLKNLKIFQGLSVSITRKMCDSKLNHLFEESAALNVYDSKTLNLAAGCPGPDLLSTLPDIMTKATAHRMVLENHFCKHLKICKF